MTKTSNSPVIGFRLDPASRALLEKAADAYGMDPAPYARWLVLNGIGAAAAAPPVRRRLMHAEELRRSLGELGRQGSNLNQLTRHLHEGGRAVELRDVVAQLKTEHAAALRALTALLVGAAQ